MQWVVGIRVQQDCQYLHDDPDLAAVRITRSARVQCASWQLQEPESTGAFHGRDGCSDEGREDAEVLDEPGAGLRDECL